MEKIVYQLDAEGLLLGTTVADESPLEEGVFLIPAGCVETAPPLVAKGLRPRWTGEAWTVEVMPTVEPALPTDEELAATARRRREILLKRCDFTQLPDAPSDTAAWAAYRQALRDISDQAGFPAAIDWPVPPV